MNDLVAFLNARLDEDEAAARPFAWTTWIEEPPAIGVILVDGEPLIEGHIGGLTAHIARHNPARVLRDIEVDRKLLAELERARAYSDLMFGPAPPASIAPGEWPGERMRAATRVLALELAVKIRAERFRDHPDFDPAWAPSGTAAGIAAPSPEAIAKAAELAAEARRAWWRRRPGQPSSGGSGSAT